MKQAYIESALLVERLHRRFLDVINTELDRLKIDDINNVQALILYNINGEQLTIGELTNRGYYLGSNVSYNVKKLVEYGYLTQEKSPHDKRSIRIRPSAKAMDLFGHLDALFQRHCDVLGKGNLDDAALKNMNQTLQTLERFWTDYINRPFRG